MPPERLHRYTSFSSLAHMLQHNRITLLDPQGWDDRNDAYFMEAYRQKVGAKGIYALCFTEAQQKYHHWSVFARGPDGVCISFHKKELVSAVADAGSSYEFKPVRYIAAQKAEQFVPFNDDGLKFTKNLRYSDEHEWRLIYTGHSGLTSNPYISFCLKSIYRITLSPWLPKPLMQSLKSVIRSMPGCGNLDVRRSTLVDYQDWKSIADRSI